MTTSPQYGPVELISRHLDESAVVRGGAQDAPIVLLMHGLGSDERDLARLDAGCGRRRRRALGESLARSVLELVCARRLSRRRVPGQNVFVHALPFFVST